jgi:organic radical activating enzyme
MEAAADSPGGFDCDTEFASGRKMTGAEIVTEAIRTVVNMNACDPWVVFTGGEPALQVDDELVQLFHDAGFRCAIETNGSKDVSDLGLDWITVSPKVAEHAVRQLHADEVKYVRGHGQGHPKPACNATYRLISPAFNGTEPDPDALAWCVQLIKENPEWRLSIQLHKYWKVR